MKIVTIVGARPQFIKAAVVSKALRNHPEIEEVLIHTGQHYDDNMSDVFFRDMEIALPDYQLQVQSSSHAAMTAEMMKKIEQTLLHTKPDYVLLYGDTNSTLAGALSASKLGIAIIHVEAGLRSFNMQMPEEINRIITDRLSSILFCPTQLSYKQLTEEGFDNFPVQRHVVGDVMMDSALMFSKHMIMPDIGLNKDEKFILLTLHRAENTDNALRLSAIMEQINTLSQKKKIVFPMHPRTEKALQQYKIHLSERIVVVEPLGFLHMLWLIQHCDFVMTDSGGLQKEAFIFGKYCITLRSETEWVELVSSGANFLIENDPKRILIYADNILSGNVSCDFSKSLYGNGNAAGKIADLIVKHHCENI